MEHLNKILEVPATSNSEGKYSSATTQATPVATPNTNTATAPAVLPPPPKPSRISAAYTKVKDFVTSSQSYSVVNPLTALQNLLTVKHVHNLSPEAQSQLASMQATIGAASSSVSKVGGGISNLFDTNVPTSLKGVLLTLLKVVPLVLTEDPRVTVALTAINLAENGAMYAAALYALAWLVKQIIKRSTPGVTPQGDDDESDEESKGYLESLYALVHYYTVGSLPTDMKGFIKALAGANIAFMFVKNLDQFGMYVFKFIKFCVNYVWFLFTGTYYFDANQIACADKFNSLVDLVNMSERTNTLNAARFKLVFGELDSLILSSIEFQCNRDFISSMQTYASTLRSRAALLAPVAAARDRTTPTVAAAFIGPPGIGKTSMTSLFARSLAVMRGQSPTEDSLIWTYQTNVNFQNPVGNELVCLLDDIGIIEDPQARAEALAFFMKLRSSIPHVVDQAFVKNIDYANFPYAFLTGNSLPSEGVTEPDAFLRGFSGGIWIPKLTHAAADENGMLDQARVNLSRYTPDEIWTFTPVGGRGDSYTFSQVARMIHNAAIKVAEDANARRISYLPPVAGHDDLPPVHFIGMPIHAIATDISITSNFNRKKGVEKDKHVSPPSGYSSPHYDSYGTSSRPTEPEPSRPPLVEVAKSTDEWVDSLSTPQINVVKQTFIGEAVPALVARVCNPQIAPAVTTFLERSSSVFTAEGTTMFQNGRPFDLNSVASLYKAPPAAAPPADLKVPLKLWSSKQFVLARDMNFSISMHDAAFDGWSYVEKAYCVGGAYGPDSKVVNFNEFCVWVVAHPELCENNIHVFSVERIRPVSAWSRTYNFLYDVVLYTAGALAALFIASGVRTMLSSVIPQAYSIKSLVRNPRTTLVPTKQGDEGEIILQGKVGPDNIQGILDKVAHNTVPAVSLKGTRTMHFHLLGLGRNVAVTVSHAVEDATMVAMSGHIATVLPVKNFDKASDVPYDTKNYIAAVARPGQDSRFLVFPRAMPLFPDITKFIANAETDINELTACGLVTIDHSVPFVAADGTTTRAWSDTVRATPFQKGALYPLGSVDIAATYDDANLDGIFVNAIAPTKPGDCGLAMISCNSRVGRGVRVVFAHHDGYLESHSKAVGASLDIESIDHFMNTCPGVSGVSIEGLPSYGVPITVERQSWVGPVADPIAQVPPSDAAHISTRNTIVPSLIQGAVHGMPYRDVTGGDLTSVPKPIEIPANMRDVAGAFSKMKYNKVPSSDYDIAIHESAVEAIYYDFVNAQPKFFEPQTDIFTIEQALNGIPEMGVPALDMNKARGIWPGCKLKNRRDLVTRTEAGWVPNPILRERLEELKAKAYAGIYVVPYVAGNLKMELRPAGKVPRQTRAYAFEHLVFARQFSMHIAAASHAGRIHNRSLVGVDLTGEDGFLLHKRSTIAHNNGKHLNDGDANNFDSSENIAVSVPIERLHARMIQDRFPFLPKNTPEIIAMSIRVTNIMIGNKLYLQWNSLNSGHLLTTEHNTKTMGSLVKGGAAIAGVSTNLYYQSYGDDFNLEDLEDDSVLKATIQHAAALGVTITSSTKKGNDIVSYTPETLVRLKRTTYKSHGITFAPLLVATLSHIGDWINVKDEPIAATRVAAESAIREWFQHGPDNFAAAKERINRALKSAGVPQVALTYDDLLVDHLGRGPYAHCKITKQSANHTTTSVTVDPMENTITTSRTNAGVATSTSADTGTITQHKLTQYRDDAGMSATTLTYNVRNELPNPLKPYGPFGVEDNLTREYPIANLTWTTGAAALTVLAVWNFPEVLYAIPNIKEKLTSAKYLRAGARLAARVNGQPGCSGRVGFAVFRGGSTTDDTRRQDPHTLLNVPQVLMSASTSVPVSFEIPWCSNRLYDDMPLATDSDGIATVVAYIHHPLVWNGTTFPTGLTINISAAFINPTVSGFDIAGGPPLSTLVGLRSKHVTGTVKKQSSSDEGFEKSVKGVVEGVTSAVDTVKTVINTAKTIAEVAAFDKPMSVQATAPTQPTIAPGFTHASGLNYSTTLGMGQDLPISVGGRLTGEASPKPTWDQFLSQPGYIAGFTISSSTPAGTVLKEFQVDPTAMYPLGLAGGPPFMPTPLAYATTVHTLWRGSIKFAMLCSASSFQKCTIRITHLPTAATGGSAVPDQLAGDANSMVVEIAGDKDVTFRVDFEGSAPYRVPRNGEPANDINCNGRIVVQLVNPISSSIGGSTNGISVSVYTAAERGFELIGYNGPVAYQYTWSPVAVATKKIVKGEKLRVTKQSALFDMFGAPFPSIVPSSPKNARGFVANDTTSGPCDLLRRPHTNSGSLDDTASGAVPVNIPIVPIEGGDFAYWIAPFQGWSSSMTIAIIPASAYAANAIYSVSRSASDPHSSAASGQTFWCTAVNPITSVTVPWTETDLYFETYAPLPLRVSPEPHVDLWDSVATPTVFWSHSMNDDLALYHFTVCPYLVPA